MNPYLEEPSLWAGVHHRLITAISIVLAPVLRPKYFVSVEERVYKTTEISEDGGSGLIGIPDDVVVKASRAIASRDSSAIAVAAPPTTTPIPVKIPMPEIVTEGYLEIRRVGTEEVITTIEILSPTNKRGGEGREHYQAKRQQILGSKTHLIEIDLLRQWQPMPFAGQPVPSHYRILVSRSDRRPRADLYAFNLPDRIPTFPLPLQPDDQEPIVDLQALLHEIYEQGSYDLRLDYRQAPIVALTETEAAWAKDWLQQQEQEQLLQT
jgi:hypothetical protein